MNFYIFLVIVICAGTVLWSDVSAEQETNVRRTVRPDIPYNPTLPADNLSNCNCSRSRTASTDNQEYNKSIVQKHIQIVYVLHNPTLADTYQSTGSSRNSQSLRTVSTENQSGDKSIVRSSRPDQPTITATLTAAVSLSNSNSRNRPNSPNTSTEPTSDGYSTGHRNIPSTDNQSSQSNSNPKDRLNGYSTGHRNIPSTENQSSQSNSNPKTRPDSYSTGHRNIPSTDNQSSQSNSNTRNRSNLPTASTEPKSDGYSTGHRNIPSTDNQSSQSNSNPKNRPNLPTASTETESDGYSTGHRNIPSTENQSSQSNNNPETRPDGYSTGHRNIPSTDNQSSQSNSNQRNRSNLPTASTETESDGYSTGHRNVPFTDNQSSQSNNNPETRPDGYSTGHRNIPFTDNQSGDKSTIHRNIPHNPNSAARNQSNGSSRTGQNLQTSNFEPTNQKKSTLKGDVVSFEIHAKIDSKLANMVKPIEKFIRSSNLRSFKPRSSNNYRVAIYSIYNSERCDQIISPIKQWYNATGRSIPSKCSKIFYEALEEQNNEALCSLKRNLNEPLKIQYATVNIGRDMISLNLELETESLYRIQNARTKLADIYDHPDSPMEPINKKLYIKLAAGKRNKVNLSDLNHLNLLVRPFTGAKLSLPSIYIDNGNQYTEFKRKTDCDGKHF